MRGVPGEIKATRYAAQSTNYSSIELPAGKNNGFRLVAALLTRQNFHKPNVLSPGFNHTSGETRFSSTFMELF